MTLQPTRDAFAQLAIEVLQQHGESRSIDYDSEKFCLKVGDGERCNFVNLGNAYDEYCGVPPEHRTPLLKHWFGRQLGEKPKLELSNVLPRIRDRAYYGLLDLRVGGMLAQAAPGKAVEPPSMPHRPFGEYFALSLVIDLPTAVVDITQKDLEELGLDFDAVYARALENLAMLSAEPFRNPKPGVYVSAYRDNHDPARLLLTERIRKLKVRGNPVAMFPNRNTLIITGAEDPAGIIELLELTKLGLLDSRPGNAIALELKPDGQWVPFLPQAPRVQRHFAEAMVRDYGEQQKLMREDFDRRDLDIFVATYNAMQKPNGQVSSYTTWSQGVDSLLPRAHEVAFVEMQGDVPGNITRVSWAAAETVVGHLMTKEIEYPPRWRVNVFPTPEQLAKMKALTPAEAPVAQSEPAAPMPAPTGNLGSTAAVCALMTGAAWYFSHSPLLTLVVAALAAGAMFGLPKLLKP